MTAVQGPNGAAVPCRVFMYSRLTPRTRIWLATVHWYLDDHRQLALRQRWGRMCSDRNIICAGASSTTSVRRRPHMAVIGRTGRELRLVSPRATCRASERCATTCSDRAVQWHGTVRGSWVFGVRTRPVVAAPHREAALGEAASTMNSSTPYVSGFCQDWALELLVGRRHRQASAGATREPSVYRRDPHLSTGATICTSTTRNHRPYPYGKAWRLNVSPHVHGKTSFE